MAQNKEASNSYSEDLENEINLDMVFIPGGSFVMGSPENELERINNENFQHLVIIQEFYMGKYQVTQAQWETVAALPGVNLELKPDPSKFKGDQRPVEEVSWYEAVEFCDRLSQYTKRHYRLPSEAEWEYACRAKTTTPFYFGETIATNVANYRGTGNKTYGWSGFYGRGREGIYLKQTTEVGSFGAPNAFGLHDMHGNVWEWCLDDYHDNYEGAPLDGSPWFDDNDSFSQKQGVLRGGSWYSNPASCRSAYRSNCASHSDQYDDFGFRVVADFNIFH